MLPRLQSTKDFLVTLSGRRHQDTHNNQDIHLDRDTHLSSSNREINTNRRRKGVTLLATLHRSHARTFLTRINNSKDRDKRSSNRFRLNGARAVGRNRAATHRKIVPTTRIDPANSFLPKEDVLDRVLRHSSSNNLKDPKKAIRPTRGRIQV